MQHNSATYTLGFAFVVCVICAALVCISAVSLAPLQKANRLLDKQKKVLDVCGLLQDGEKLSADDIVQRFNENIVARVVNLETGEYVGEDVVDPATYDQIRAAKDPETSRKAPDNRAQVARIPNYALVYHVVKDGAVEKLVLPIEGKGLWSTLYGFLVLEKDVTTIGGITFYQHGETPGLGGEIDNPLWKAKWPGRKAFDENWVPKIKVVKGDIGPADTDPYRVDALAGATITSRGVSNLLAFWLGDNGFGPYLTKFREQPGSA